MCFCLNLTLHRHQSVPTAYVMMRQLNIYLLIVMKPRSCVQIQQWSSARSITLPNPNFQTIILGVDSPLLNHLILLYKIILYKRRDTGKAPTLESYIIYVKSVMDIEWSIAKKRGKVEQCSKKWS